MAKTIRLTMAQALTRYLARQIEFDPDIWIVEVEDKAGRHFLGDSVVEG